MTHDCYTSCYAFALRELGHDQRVLGGERAFCYARDPIAPWPLDHLRWTRRSYAELMRAWHGVEEQQIAHPSPEVAWRHIQEAHATGRPVIVFVSTSELAHLAGQPKDQPHRVVVADSHEDKAHVVDETIGMEFDGWIEARRLRRAITSPALTGLLYPARNVTIELLQGKPPAIPPADRALESLRLLGAGGTEALRLLAADMDRDAPLEPDGRLSLRRYVEGSAVFGELRSQRRLNALSLDLAFELTGLDLDDPIARANQLAASWHALQLVFRLVALKRPRDVLRQMKSRLEQIAALEDGFAAAVAVRLEQASGT